MSRAMKKVHAHPRALNRFARGTIDLAGADSGFHALASPLICLEYQLVRAAHFGGGLSQLNNARDVRFVAVQSCSNINDNGVAFFEPTRAAQVMWEGAVRSGCNNGEIHMFRP